LTEQKLSGAVWSIVSDKGEIISDAAGYKNLKSKLLLSPTDKVHVGSVCKTILAAGFLRMATLGLINLDDPVKKYLPNLPVENQWDKTNPVTIRHLLDHTSGLTDAKLWHVFSTTATPNTALETVYFNTPGILKIQVIPGSIYSYSNLGYTILGMVIEKTTNQRYEDYLDKNLLTPLGMTNSSFHFISQNGSNADKQLAYGHFDNGDAVAAMPMYLRPAGQLTTTAGDMGKFLRFMMSDGTINGATFIRKEYLISVGDQKQTDARHNGVPFGDALGAYTRDRYGVVGIAKNGNTLGFSAMIYLFPNEKKAFFVAQNTDSETANYDLFNEALVKYLDLPKKPFIAKEQNIENNISNWNGYYVPVITKVEPFRLFDYIFSYTKVEISKTRALLKPFQGKNRALVYQGNHLFSMNDRINISHSFYKSGDGALLITDGVKTMKKVSGVIILAIAISIFLGLLGLIYLFVVGLINLIKYRLKFFHQPISWVFIAISILIISLALMANQSFMSIGDITIGNIILAIGSVTIPFFSIVSLVLAVKTQAGYLRTVNFWAIFCVLQFCMLLIANKIIPIYMWR